MKEKIKTICLVLITAVIVIVGIVFAWSMIKNQSYADKERAKKECVECRSFYCSGSFSDCALEREQKCGKICEGID